MVISNIDCIVTYSEGPEILDGDMGHESNIYEITVFGKNISVILGRERMEYITHNILYIPIYLVENEKLSMRIGLYEIDTDEITDYLDSDNDIDINMLGDPLIFDFVKTKLSGNNFTKIYDSSSKCIFTVIENIFMLAEKNIEKNTLKNIIAGKIDKNIFETLKNKYILQCSRNDLTKQLSAMKKKFNETDDNRIKYDIVQDAEKVVDARKKIVDNPNIGFMNNVDTIDDLVYKIKNGGFELDRTINNLIEKTLKINISFYKNNFDIASLNAGDNIILDKTEDLTYIPVMYNNKYIYNI